MSVNYVQIGYTQKPHGVKGEIKLHVEEAYYEDFAEAETFFVLIKGKHTPFFLESIREGNHIIAKFEDVNTPEKAMQMASKELYLREQDLIPGLDRTVDDGLTYSHCTGFSITDEDFGFVGVVTEMIEMPQQEIAIVVIKNREVMIPLNAAFVKAIDKKAKTITTTLPDGLLDL